MTTKAPHKDVIEKWLVVAGLHGVSLANFWDSNDHKAREVLDNLEQIEEFNRLRAEAETSFKIAQKALDMGLDSDKIYQYHQWVLDEEARKEEARLQAEEDANACLKHLREAYKMKLVDGTSEHQTYWTFEADLGDGVRLYKCRHVRVSWFTQRIWREWTDSSGVKRKEKFEFSRSGPWQMDDRWPERWKQQYNRNFSNVQFPYAYTDSLIRSNKPKKVSKKKGVKAV